MINYRIFIRMIKKIFELKLFINGTLSNLLLSYCNLLPLKNFYSLLSLIPSRFFNTLFTLILLYSKSSSAILIILLFLKKFCYLHIMNCLKLLSKTINIITMF